MSTATNPKIDHARVVAAIRRAEKQTSGEIRVVVCRERSDDPIATARQHFVRLEMTKTPERNGVLILLAPRSKNFAVIGDTGIHEKCGDAFWQDLAGTMTDYFKRSDFTGALELAVARTGTLLATHFPPGKRNPNVLPDSVEDG